MITLSIDTTLLDASRFKKVTKRNGKEAAYCELVLIDTPNGQYGDFMVKQSVTREERTAKLEMPILGNGKNWAKSEQGNRRPSSPAGSQRASGRNPDDSVTPPVGDDVPF